MKILINPEDLGATEFIKHLDWSVRLTRINERECELPGGGNIPIICWSTDSSELGKKSISMMVGKSRAVAPDWCPDLAGKVALAINRDLIRSLEYSSIIGNLAQLTKPWTAPKKLRGRGGAVVFEKFASTNRVLEQPRAIQGSNKAIKRLTGVNGVTVNYGTTDVINVFELLELIKTASFLGLPAVYDTYSYAHTAGNFWQRVLEPSLKLFCDQPRLEPLALPKDKMTCGVDPYSIAKAFAEYGLNNIAPIAADLGKGETFAGWYRKGAKYLALFVNEILGLDIELHTVASEDLIALSPVSQKPLSSVTWDLGTRTGHSFVLANLSDVTRISSQDSGYITFSTIDQLHKRNGWLGGAVIYEAIYSLGSLGPIVIMTKDSKAGLIHRLAEPYLTGNNQTYLAPVGLTRLSASGQDPDASIDLWVFMELISRWGDKAKENLMKIWEAFEVPLTRENIGDKTLVTVDLDGISVSHYCDY